MGVQALQIQHAVIESPHPPVKLPDKLKAFPAGTITTHGVTFNLVITQNLAMADPRGVLSIPAWAVRPANAKANYRPTMKFGTETAEVTVAGHEFGGENFTFNITRHFLQVDPLAFVSDGHDDDGELWGRDWQELTRPVAPWEQAKQPEPDEECPEEGQPPKRRRRGRKTDAASDATAGDADEGGSQDTSLSLYRCLFSVCLRVYSSQLLACVNLPTATALFAPVCVCLRVCSSQLRACVNLPTASFARVQLQSSCLDCCLSRPQLVSHACQR